MIFVLRSSTLENLNLFHGSSFSSFRRAIETRAGENVVTAGGIGKTMNKDAGLDFHAFRAHGLADPRLGAIDDFKVRARTRGHRLEQP